MRLFSLLVILLTSCSVAASDGISNKLNLTQHWVGYTAFGIFVLAYLLVILEEKLNLRKSTPVLLGAGLIWILIAFVYSARGDHKTVEQAINGNFVEYAELFFFLLVAMTYINTMLERGVFNTLRYWLVNKALSYRTLFWITGFLAFFLSAVADNLTTALIMCAVVLATGKDKPKFISIACINIVIAANAGGAFSPFGDITTLMVWQKGELAFSAFFNIFLPSAANYLIPAFIMQFAILPGRPQDDNGDEQVMKKGAVIIISLFLLTIITAVSFQNFLHLPPVFGMMIGLAYLKIFSYYMSIKIKTMLADPDIPDAKAHERKVDVFEHIANAEWDTLFFFYGVIMAVGGLGFIGYLGLASAYMYGELGATNANVLVGVLSSIVDNIPVMYAVLTMEPQMDQFQWLLVTFTAGVGGSLLSIGSAAGVALMGQARGHYTFFSHLKWTPVIALGYAGGIWVHFFING